MNHVRKLVPAVAAASLPFLLFGFSSGPQIRRSGAPGDTNCTACHFGTALNAGGGSVLIEAANYKPGQKQKIRVTVSDPAQSRWGFELTARVGESTIPAGSFVVNDTVRVRCDDGTPLGSAAPCASSSVAQYVTHVADSTAAGKTGGQTWEVEWMPPDQEVGDVVFYAAGNAANNSGTPAGDHIYTTNTRIHSEGACPLSAKPALRTIGNAATSNAALSVNSLISLYGLGFAPQGVKRTAGPGDIQDNKFAKELACVAVEVAGQRVPITYVQPDQINAQMPTISTTGQVAVKVILNPGKPNEISSDVATITVQGNGPAFFTYNGSTVAAQHADYTPVANPSVVSTGTAARPGEIIILYTTGLGPSNPVYQAGEIVPSGGVPLRDPVTVIVGGTTLAASDVLYSGIAPSAISGLYQLNVRLPSSLSPGDVPISLTSGGVTSPSGTTIPIRAAQ